VALLATARQREGAPEVGKKARSKEASAVPSPYEPYRYLEETFVPRKYSGRIMLFWPTDDAESPEDAASRWSNVARELQNCLSKARHNLPGAK